MLGSSEPIFLPQMKTVRNRSTSYSLSPEDKTFLPQYMQKHELITIKTQFNNELIAESIEKKHYLDSASREKYRVTIKDGFFYSADGERLAGPFVFVILPDYRLYAAPLNISINHSHLSSGLPLRGAGILYMEYGRVITMSNDSGHYKPNFHEMSDAIDWISRQSQYGSFVFEDHSKQNKELEFQGIRYFKKEAEPHLADIANADLIDALYTIKTEALAALKRQSLLEDSDSSSSEYSECNVDCYVTLLCEVEVKRPMGPSILDCPDLLQYTCLYKLNSSSQLSRFVGLPSRMPTKRE